MRVTNKSNLPEAIVRAVENDTYNRGVCDYTVTELLKPPRQRALQKRHGSMLTEDAADMAYRLYGQIVHGILERANALDLVERRFFGAFEVEISSEA